MKHVRILLALCAFAVPAAVAAGCGGVPGDAVATVDGNTIDKTQFTHWMNVAARTSGQPNAKAPDPPDYAACIADKRKTAPKPAKGKDKVSNAQIAAYYNKNKARFAQPEQRELRIVLTKDKAKAEQAKKALDSGDSWKTVAKKYSVNTQSK